MLVSKYTYKRDLGFCETLLELLSNVILTKVLPIVGKEKTLFAALTEQKKYQEYVLPADKHQPQYTKQDLLQFFNSFSP